MVPIKDFITDTLKDAPSCMAYMITPNTKPFGGKFPFSVKFVRGGIYSGFKNNTNEKSAKNFVKPQHVLSAIEELYWYVVKNPDNKYGLSYKFISQVKSKHRVNFKTREQLQKFLIDYSKILQAIIDRDDIDPSTLNIEYYAPGWEVEQSGCKVSRGKTFPTINILVPTVDETRFEKISEDQKSIIPNFLKMKSVTDKSPNGYKYKTSITSQYAYLQEGMINVKTLYGQIISLHDMFNGDDTVYVSMSGYAQNYIRDIRLFMDEEIDMTEHVTFQSLPRSGSITLDVYYNNISDILPVGFFDKSVIRKIKTIKYFEDN